MTETIFKVTRGCTLHELAVRLHGSFEGIFDLLVSNPNLESGSILKSGDEITYHPDFAINKPLADRLEEEDIWPANGNRNVFPASFDPTQIWCLIDTRDADYLNLRLSGTGSVATAWDDSHQTEYRSLSSTAPVSTHYFNPPGIPHRTFLLAGSTFSLNLMEIGRTDCDIYLTRQTSIRKLSITGSSTCLGFLPLVTGLEELSVKGSLLNDLAPLDVCRSLKQLHLEGTSFRNHDALAQYLRKVSESYGERPSATIYLSREATQAETAALNTVNTLAPQPWKITIL